ncbi:MAG: hypothetical protein H7Y89_04275 [Steroidobacteraceae bacterium]|nr:hypothetical protein [Steroidobacteraceae bacterium]
MLRRSLQLVAILLATPAFAGINVLSPTGPPGGYALDVEYVSGGALLATTSRGIYRSTDDGANWTRIQRAANASSMPIVVNPANRSVVLWRGDLFLYRSTDAGLTWTAVPNLPGGLTATSTPIVFAANGTLAWAAGAPAVPLLRSGDGGATWTAPAASGLTGSIYSLSVDAANAQILYVATADGAFRSSDAGASFSPIPVAQYVRSVVASATTPGTLIAIATGPGVEVDRVWRSVDGGTTWSGPATEAFNFVEYVPGVAGKAYATTAGERLSMTLDDGATWTDLGPLPNGRVHGLAVDTANAQRMLIATYGGVFTSTNAGASWTERSAGFRDALLRQVLANRTGDGAMYLMSGDLTNVWRRVGAGGNWEARGAAATPLLGPSASWNALIGQNVLAVSMTDASSLYLARDSRFAVSTDGGTTWTRRADTPIAASTLAVAPVSFQTVYAGGLDLMPHRSIDGGATWTSLASSGLPAGARFFAFDPLNPLVIYSAGNQVSGAFSAFVYKSTNGGVTFQPLSWTPPANIGALWTLVHDPIRSNILYLSAYTGLYRSSDGGATWTHVPLFSVPRDDGGPVSLEIDVLRPDVLYAGSWSRNRIARSVDGGATWDSLGDDELSSVAGLALVPGTRSRIVATTPWGAHEIEFMPDLRVTHPNAVVRAGAAATTVLEVRNAGEVAASEVRFFTSMPASTSSIDATAGTTACTIAGREITCSLGILAAGQSKSVTVNYTPNSADSWIPAVAAYEPDTTPLDNVSLVLVAGPASPGSGSSGGGGSGGGGSLDYLLLLALLGALASRKR